MHRFQWVMAEVETVLSRKFVNDPLRHPAPTSEHLGFLCLCAILRDPSSSEKIRAQASELGWLLDPQHFQRDDRLEPFTADVPFQRRQTDRTLTLVRAA